MAHNLWIRIQFLRQSYFDQKIFRFRYDSEWKILENMGTRKHLWWDSELKIKLRVIFNWMKNNITDTHIIGACQRCFSFNSIIWLVIKVSQIGKTEIRSNHAGIDLNGLTEGTSPQRGVKLKYLPIGKKLLSTNKKLRTFSIITNCCLLQPTFPLILHRIVLKNCLLAFFEKRIKIHNLKGLSLKW